MSEAYSDLPPDQHPAEMYNDALKDGERDCFACGTTVLSNPCEHCGGETTPPPPSRYFDGLVSNLPELNGQFPDPVLTAAALPLSDALQLFPQVEGTPQINFESVHAFASHFALSEVDAETYLDILKEGAYALSDGRRRGISYRMERRKSRKSWRS